LEETPVSIDKSSSAPSDFEITPSPFRRLGEFLFGSFWSLFTLLTLFPPSGDSFLPWLTVPLGALASFHFLKRGFDARPRLVVDSKGVLDRTSVFGRELHVPWQEIREVSVSKLNGVVLLHVRDLRALYSHATLGRRFELWVRRLRGFRSVGIGPTLLGMKHSEIGRRIGDALVDYERAELGLAPESTEDREQIPPGDNACDLKTGD